jgi:hypothetical protein
VTSPVFAANHSPAVEAQVVADMARRALPAFPVLILVAGLIWGVDGALSAAFAVALAVGNLVLSAVLMARAARISLALLMVAALGGFILRLVLLTVAVWTVADQAWVEMVPLGLTLIVTHLGMLIWETRHVSASLAFPGLKPTASELAGGRR